MRPVSVNRKLKLVVVVGAVIMVSLLSLPWLMQWLPGLGIGSHPSGPIARTRAQVQVISMALETYCDEFGRYPTQISALYGQNPKGLALLSDPGVLTDAWGNPIEVRLDPAGRWYEIKSLGADGKVGPGTKPQDADIVIESATNQDESVTGNDVRSGH